MLEQAPISARMHAVAVAGARPQALARSPAAAYVADVRGRLGITETQAEAWMEFAETLWANRQRLQAIDARADGPYGAVEDRRAALAAMRRAATRLFSILGVGQQEIARRLLPLSCQPTLRCGSAAG